MKAKVITGILFSHTLPVKNVNIAITFGLVTRLTFEKARLINLSNFLESSLHV
jgi:hypothetical protein